MREEVIPRLREHLISRYPDYNEIEFAREVERLISRDFKPVAFVYGREDDTQLLELLGQLYEVEPSPQLLKKPIGTWKDGRGSAIINSAAGFMRKLREWGRLNVGIYLDKFAAIDIDDPSLLPPFSPPSTLTHRTGGGGQHLIYAITDEKDEEIAKKYKGILRQSERSHSEIRLKFKEVLITPPSLHPSGKRYERVVDTDPLPLKLALPFIQWIKGEIEWEKGEGSENLERGREIIEGLGILYNHLPPCVRYTLALPYVHGVKHIPNPFLLFFFRTIGVSEDDFVRIFLAFKIDADEKKTRKYAQRWTRIAEERGKGYISHGCEKLRAAGLCPGCELKGRISNPLSYYHYYNLKRVRVTLLQEEWELVPESLKIYFPHEKARRGQIESVMKLFELSLQGERLIFEAPTGYGKTAVIVALAKLFEQVKIPTLIVEPQRGLQDQIQKYGIYVLKGRKAYKCEVTGRTADVAPCLHPRYECENIDRCEYKKAWREAHMRLEEGKCVCINHGLYYHFRERAKRVIFDEFHSICANLSQEIWLQSCEQELETAEATVKFELSNRERELAEIEAYIESLDPEEDREEFEKAVKKREKLRSLINRLRFFLRTGCIVYTRKKRSEKRVFAKLEENVCANALLRRGYIGVSATPPRLVSQDIRIIPASYEVATKENAPIVYLPIVKLTVREALLTGNSNIRLAAETFCALLTILREESEDEKFIVHCGNTHDHMQILREVLSKKFKVLVHEKGKLDRTIREFRERNYDVLLVAAADVGYDFFDYHYQFIFKLPYENRNDPEWKAIEKKYGKEEADKRYHQKLIDRIVQICGRICRGREDWGITYILDSKFGELYERYRDFFPESFAKRLIFSESEEK